MIEETFHLHPPDWLAEPPRPKSTAIFRHYVKDAPTPKMWAADTSTYQGFYIMSPAGEFLTGSFGIVREAKAAEMMNSALKKWQKTGAAMRPVPSNELSLYGGDEPKPGAVKLQVAYRDLPRGDIERPSSADVQNPYNLGWFDLTAKEAMVFLSESNKPTAIPQALFAKLVTTKLKDAVQGQMSRWSSEALQKGFLMTQRVSSSDGEVVFRLTGSVDLSENGRSYKAQLHGKIIYDLKRSKFQTFDLVAVGQRSGKGGANGRATDPGPAPYGSCVQAVSPGGGAVKESHLHYFS